MSRFLLQAFWVLSVLGIWLGPFLSPVCLAAENQADQKRRTPVNVVLFFIDDLGYGDIGPFGARGDLTPNLDRMASEGRVFTDFVVSSSVCSASRAALLTGAYHQRVGIRGALFPDATIGINADELTLAELCQSKGYATAIYGKWHLGHHPKFLPTAHGFDEYYGIPYSNDMWQRNSHFRVKRKDGSGYKSRCPMLPMISANTKNGIQIVDDDVSGEDQALMTRQFTERAVDFIRRNTDRPFFVYLPHPMVHVPLYVSENFRGKSGAGLFGDVVMEVDWSVGQVLDVLKEVGIDDNTLVIFTGDNGPWLSYGNHAGTAGPLREGKGTMFEGGYREPTVMRWPSKIPAGTTCDQLCSSIDLLPTIAKLIGGELPKHKLDGKDIRSLMFGDSAAKTPHDYFYCYQSGGCLQAIRDSRYKLVFPHTYRTLRDRDGGKDGKSVKYNYTKAELALYDLQEDVAEQHNILGQHPEIVQRLQAAAEIAREDLGDRLQKRKPSGVRPPGRLGPGDDRLPERWE